MGPLKGVLREIWGGGYEEVPTPIMFLAPPVCKVCHRGIV